MIYKGLVIEVNRKYAIVMTESLEYFKVILRAQLFIGKKILFSEDDLYRESSKIVKNILLYAAIFAIAFLSPILPSSNSSHNIPYEPAAIISIDINPSIELEINNQYEVAKIKAFNNEGYRMLNDEFVGLPMEKAVYMIINNAKTEGYITTENHFVLLSIAAIGNNQPLSTQELQQRLSEDLSKKIDSTEIDITYITSDEDSIKEARTQDITIGKYELYRKFNEGNESITLEEVKSSSVQNLVRRFRGSSEKNNHIESDSTNRQRQGITENNTPETADEIKQAEGPADTSKNSGASSPQYRLRRNNPNANEESDKQNIEAEEETAESLPPQDTTTTIENLPEQNGNLNNNAEPYKEVPAKYNNKSHTEENTSSNKAGNSKGKNKR
ncbi:MAG: anti-sigma factor domain-containing protein [Clostridia bacterium]